MQAASEIDALLTELQTDRHFTNRSQVQKQSLALHQDIVVATPAKLLEHHSAKNVFLRDVQVLVRGASVHTPC